jgi:hypothetical protein
LGCASQAAESGSDTPLFRLGKSTIAAFLAVHAPRFTESVWNDSRRCGAMAYVVHRCAQRLLGQSIKFFKNDNWSLDYFVAASPRGARGDSPCNLQ